MRSREKVGIFKFDGNKIFASLLNVLLPRHDLGGKKTLRRTSVSALFACAATGSGYNLKQFQKGEKVWNSIDTCTACFDL